MIPAVYMEELLLGGEQFCNLDLLRKKTNHLGTQLNVCSPFPIDYKQFIHHLQSLLPCTNSQELIGA